ncbi:hypothetical protein TWF481_011507 [Arthrobotrys musiformis]|uniref:Laccase n=1 Tax=Arthrobotrys musiformis TaxID=47236 RepID=A0AAV9W1I0_9PEZI
MNRSICNTDTTRQTWCRLDNSDDDDGAASHICFDYESVPVTRKHKIGVPEGQPEILKETITIDYGYIRPDGYLKKAMLINGTYPGPLIRAYWGQTIQLKVINRLGVDGSGIRNGTSIHPHGFRLWNRAGEDGVPGVTQCPIPPGSSFTYTWEVNQYGTTWYHSHLSLQYPNGIVAPMILEGPKSANYDIDVGAILLTDWYHDNPFAIYQDELRMAQVPNSTLINGKGKFDCSLIKTTDLDPERCKEGSYWEHNFVTGKWHLLRFVNTATASTFRVSIDQHDMIIITVDFTSVRPSIPLKYIEIAVGQRYEVLVYGNYSAADGDFWLRSEPMNCNQGHVKNHINPSNVAKGIIRYGGGRGKDPTSISHIPKDFPHDCKDVETENIVPVFSRGSGAFDFKNLYNTSEKLQVSLVPNNNTNAAKLELGTQMPLRGPESGPLPEFKGNLWQILGVPMEVNWSSPAMLLYSGKAKPSDFPAKYAVLEETLGPRGSMRNIHGHDFVVLAQGPGNFDEKNMEKFVYNPVRRDVATMPANGYLIISFPVDNPGIWLLHCHLAWHASQGLALMILEKTVGYKPPVLNWGQEMRPMASLTGNCERWINYTLTPPYPDKMDDSGV